MALPGHNELTHWGLNKMATNLQNIFKCIYFDWKVYILVQISLKFVPVSLLDKKSALVQVMAWCRQATSHDLNQ